jgi:hypothetical protein
MVGVKVKPDGVGGTVHLSKCSYFKFDFMLRHYGFDNFKPVSIRVPLRSRDQVDVDVALFCTK